MCFSTTMLHASSKTIHCALKLSARVPKRRLAVSRLCQHTLALVAGAWIATTSVGFVIAADMAESIAPQPSTYNFGRVASSSTRLACTFTLSNTSLTTVLLNRIVTSCGCTVVSHAPASIPPHSSTDLPVGYSCFSVE